MKKPRGPFTLVDNDCGDEYVIPLSKLDHWYNEWMHSEAWEAGDIPWYATYVGGRLKFYKWSEV